MVGGNSFRFQDQFEIEKNEREKNEIDDSDLERHAIPVAGN